MAARLMMQNLYFQYLLDIYLTITVVTDIFQSYNNNQ